MAGESLATIFKKGHPITLAGREFKIAPLGMEGLAELEAYIRSKKVAIAVMALERLKKPASDIARRISQLVAEPLEPGELEQALGQIDEEKAQEAAKKGFAVGQPDVQFKMMWLSLRRFHPELTEQELEQVLMEATDTEKAALQGIQVGLAGMALSDGESGENPTPAIPDGQNESPT